MADTQKRILIVEDDSVLRDLYLRKFTRGPFKVSTAVNGEEALKSIAAGKPDIVLLDLNMPVLGGYEMLEKLPKEQRTFPVIILTNFDDQANRERGKTLGVSDYFVKKDMTIKSLWEMVEQLLK
jgi:DNA-binding response OmpR family regulator